MSGSSTTRRTSARLALMVFAIAASLAGSAHAQAPAAQICKLGDLKLESGKVIPNFQMSYITFGKFDDKKNNAVLSLHGLRGNRNSQSMWADRCNSVEHVPDFTYIE